MYTGMTIGPSLRRTLYKLAEKQMSPSRVKFLLNIWPPLWGSGIRITDISEDWSTGRLELRLNRLTANMHGAAFGGALFSMTDVLFGTLVMQRLDVKKFEAWTRTGSFEFIRPGRRGAYLEVSVSDEMVEQILRETEGGYSTVISYTSVVRNPDGSLVGIGQQDLYVRRRGGDKPPANPNQQDHVAGENLIAAARTLARLGMRNLDNRDLLVQQERMARRCVTPEARAVAWLQGILDLGEVTVDDYRAAGLPDVVLEALTSDAPLGPGAGVARGSSHRPRVPGEVLGPHYLLDGNPHHFGVRLLLPVSRPSAPGSLLHADGAGVGKQFLGLRIPVLYDAIVAADQVYPARRRWQWGGAIVGVWGREARAGDLLRHRFSGEEAGEFSAPPAQYSEDWC